MKQLIKLLVSFIFIGCGGVETQFLGKWKEAARENYLEITHDGDQYFVEFTNRYGRKEKYVAIFEGGELKYDILGGIFNKLGVNKMAIVHDNNLDRLYISGDEYERVTQ